MTGIPSVAIVLSLSVCALSGAACVGGDAPDDPFATGAGGKGGSGSANTGGTGGSGAVKTYKAGAKDSHFPLVDGATWNYLHKYPQDPGKAEWNEIANMRSTTYMDKPGFILEDEEDAQGERSASTMLIGGTRIDRVYKEVKVAGQVAFHTTYNPGFLRYDEAWTQEGSSVDDAYTSEQLCVMASVASKCAPGAMKKGNTSHTFKVVSLDAEVTVPAGTFKGTVQIERINLGDGTPGDKESKHFWYAPGIGKVKELDLQSMATEELTEYTVP